MPPFCTTYPSSLIEYHYVLLSLLSAFWGACIGSFLNVCIYRIPREVSVVTPRSHCPSCKKFIPWYLNIPIITYVMLGGKCRYCGNRISMRYFLIEVLTAALFFMVWLKLGVIYDHSPLGLVTITDWKLVPIYWLFVSGLILGTFVDLEHFIIPDRVTIGGIIAGIILSVVAPSMHDQTTRLAGLTQSLIGAATGWFILWTVAILGTIAFRKEAMGFGDVKLMGAIGAFLGWRAVLFTVIGSSLVGSLIGLTLVISGKKEMQGRIPYGPYIALAALIWVFWGSAWWDAYMNMMTPLP